MNFVPSFLTLITLFAWAVQPCSGQPSSTEIKAFVTTAIWNRPASDSNFSMVTIGYGQIPNHLEFKGVVVLALQWKDKDGENILVLTQSGSFPLPQQTETINNFGAELNAYLFHRQNNSTDYSQRWKIHDSIYCRDSIVHVAFYPRSLFVTDLDHDEIAEITLIYSMSCGNGNKPGDKKIIMYEAEDKYEMKGQSTVCFQTAKGPDFIGGIYRADGKLIGQKVFYEFLKIKWKICDGGY